MQQCPICHREFPARQIQAHVNSCIDNPGAEPQRTALQQEVDALLADRVVNAQTESEDGDQSARRLHNEHSSHGSTRLRFLRELSTGGKLYVRVVGAKNLSQPGLLASLAISCALDFEGQVVSTSVKPFQSDPQWNQDFIFDVVEFFGPATLTLTLQLHGGLSSQKTAGTIRVPLSDAASKAFLASIANFKAMSENGRALSAAGMNGGLPTTPSSPTPVDSPRSRLSPISTASDSKWSSERDEKVEPPSFVAGTGLVATSGDLDHPAPPLDAPDESQPRGLLVPLQRLDIQSRFFPLDTSACAGVQLELLYIPIKDVRAPVVGQWTALHCAAADGRLQLMSHLCSVVRSKHLPRTSDAEGLSPADIACLVGEPGAACLTKLVDTYHLPLGRSVTRRTILHYSVMGGWMPTIQFIVTKLLKVVRQNVDHPNAPVAKVLDVKDVMGHTALGMACERGNLAAVRFLISKGADPGTICGGGNTCLTLSLKHCHPEVAQYLLTLERTEPGGQRRWLARPACSNHAGETPLYLASRHGYASIVKLLVSMGMTRAAATRAGDTPLHVAAQFGHMDVVRALTLTGFAGAAGSVSVHGSSNGKVVTSSSDTTSSSSAAKADKVDEFSFFVALGHGIGDDGRGRFYDPRSERVVVGLVDAHGRTPLWYAQRGETVEHRDIAELLQRLAATERAATGAEVSVAGDTGEDSSYEFEDVDDDAASVDSD